MQPKKAKLEVAEEEVEVAGELGEDADVQEAELEGAAGEEEMDEDEEELGAADLGEVDVEFEARELSERDRDMVTQFLKKAIKVPSGGLADLVLGEHGVGSSIHMPSTDEEMVRVGDALDELETDASDEGLGFLTVVDMGRHWERVCVAQAADFLLTHSPPDLQERMDKILQIGTGPVGLLLNERHLHIPPQIAPPLFGALVKEVEKSKMKLEYYVLLAQTYRAAGKPDQEPTFGKGEEECFYRNREFSYDIEMRKATNAEDDGERDDVDAYRTVIVVSAEKMPNVMNDMRNAWSV